MKRKIFNSYVCVIAAFAIWTTSCVDVDLDDLSKGVKLEQSLVVPIGEGTLTVGNFLTSFDIGTNVEFSGDTINFRSTFEDEYAIKDVDLLKDASSTTFSLLCPPGLVNENSSIYPADVNFTMDLKLDPTSTTKRCDSVHVSSFIYNVEVASVSGITRMDNLPLEASDLNIQLKFSKIRDITQDYPYSKSIGYQFNQATTNTLDNVLVNLSGLTGIPLEVQLTSGNNKLIMALGAKITLKLTPSTMSYVQAWGAYMPETQNTTKIETSLSMLKDLPDGIRFVNPKLYIQVSSNIGSYLAFDINYIKAYDSKGAEATHSVFAGGSTSFNHIINVKPSVVQQYITTQLPVFNKDNGSTDRLFDTDADLDKLVCEFGLSNYVANDGTTSFVAPGMKVKTKTDVVVPLQIKTGNPVSHADTLNNLEDIFKNIKRAGLVVKTYNALPVKVVVGLKFYDAEGGLIDVALGHENYTVNSAEVDNDGNVTKGVETSLLLSLSEEDQLKLRSADKLVYTLDFSGQEVDRTIFISKNNYFRLNLGAYGKASYSTNIGSSN